MPGTPDDAIDTDDDMVVLDVDITDIRSFVRMDWKFVRLGSRRYGREQWYWTERNDLIDTPSESVR